MTFPWIHAMLNNANLIMKDHSPASILRNILTSLHRCLLWVAAWCLDLTTLQSKTSRRRNDSVTRTDIAMRSTLQRIFNNSNICYFKIKLRQHIISIQVTILYDLSFYLNLQWYNVEECPCSVCVTRRGLSKVRNGVFKCKQIKGNSTEIFLRFRWKHDDLSILANLHAPLPWSQPTPTTTTPSTSTTTSSLPPPNSQAHSPAPSKPTLLRSPCSIRASLPSKTSQPATLASFSTTTTFAPGHTCWTTSHGKPSDVQLRHFWTELSGWARSWKRRVWSGVRWHQDQRWKTCRSQACCKS